MDGACDMNPYEYKNVSACDYCAYKTMCGFDKGISGYKKRRIPKMDPEEVLSRMETE
jgi:ATP-dependent helicase/nuclease subunit B